MVSKGAIGAIRRYTAALPSVALEKSLPMLGRRYTVQQRLMSVVVKAAEYSLVGIGCGALGQGIANSRLYSAPRSLHPSLYPRAPRPANLRGPVTSPLQNRGLRGWNSPCRALPAQLARQTIAPPSPSHAQVLRPWH